jgi:hypothetical protein
MLSWPLAEESPLQSQALLSAVLADRLDHAQSTAVTAALSIPDTFAAIVAVAERERVLPALHRGVSGRFHNAAKFWRAVVMKAYQENRRRNAQIRAAFLELGEAAAAQHMRLAALKGAAWILEDEAECAAWRWMIDLDVLVDAEAFGRIPALLGRLGYKPVSQAKRYRNNFHHAPYGRPNLPATIEVHRHLGWRHELLAPEIVFGSARAIAAGLWLPAPWCRAFHAIIRWQIQDRGWSRGLIRLKDVLEVARFLSRADVDWDRLAAHGRAVGGLEACQAAVGIAAELLGATIPSALTPERTARRHIERALLIHASASRTWFATEIWRAGTLWRCEKVAYRLAVGGARPTRIRIAVWAARLVRLPILAARLLAILLRGVRLWAAPTGSPADLRSPPLRSYGRLLRQPPRP